MTEVGILGIGVATMDIYVDKKRMYPGGNEYNVAYHAKQLGAKAGFLGVFGDDTYGPILEKSLLDGQVDISHCHHEKGTSGYSLVVLKEDGDRVFLDWNHEGVTDLYPIGFTDEEMDYLRSFDVVTLGRCASVSLDHIKKIARAGIPVCYDFHAAFTAEDIESIAPFTTYAFFSCSHLDEQSIKTILKKAVDLGVSIAVGTSGSDPVRAYDGNQYYTHNVIKVEALDTLGAGDSYIAGFLTNYLRFRKDGRESSDCISKALELAAQYSAQIVQIEGSIGVGYDVEEIPQY